MAPMAHAHMCNPKTEEEEEAATVEAAAALLAVSAAAKNDMRAKEAAQACHKEASHVCQKDAAQVCHKKADASPGGYEANSQGGVGLTHSSLELETNSKRQRRENSTAEGESVGEKAGGQRREGGARGEGFQAGVSGEKGLSSGDKRVHASLECEAQGGAGVGCRGQRAAVVVAPVGTLSAAIESSPKRQRV